jgi:hypothetical protein
MQTSINTNLIPIGHIFLCDSHIEGEKIEHKNPAPLHNQKMTINGGLNSLHNKAVSPNLVQQM